MKKRYFYYLIVLILFTACNSEGYDEAANEIATNYGGEFYYGNGSGAGLTKGGYKYLSLELNGGLALQYGINPELILGHMAYAFSFYIPDNVSEIQCELTLNSIDNKLVNLTKTFKSSELKIIQEKSKIIETCIELIKDKSTDNLLSLMKDDYKKNIDKEILLDQIEEALIFIGNYESFIHKGFYYVDEQTIHLSSLIKGDKNMINFSIEIDKNAINESSIVNLNFVD